MLGKGNWYGYMGTLCTIFTIILQIENCFKIKSLLERKKQTFPFAGLIPQPAHRQRQPSLSALSSVCAHYLRLGTRGCKWPAKHSLTESTQKLEFKLCTQKNNIPKHFVICQCEQTIICEKSKMESNLLFLTQQMNSQWLPAITTIIAYRQHLFQIKECSLKFSLNAHYCFGVDILGAMTVQVPLCRVEFLYEAEALCGNWNGFCSVGLLFGTNISFRNCARERKPLSLLLHDCVFSSNYSP